MQDFKNYLMENFGKSVSEISSTEFDNVLVDKDFKMISWDDVATYFHENNDEFKHKFSSADGLYILEKDNKTQLFFFEFKNIDYSNDKDRQMSLYHLKNYLKQMNECDAECEIHDDIEKVSEYLVDVSHVSIRSKPSDSLSLFYYMMKEYYDLKDDESGIKKLFEADKFFFLISNTPAEYRPFKNKSNRKDTIIEPLNFLKRFEPYHYKMVFAVYKTGFDRYFYKRNKEYFN